MTDKTNLLFFYLLFLPSHSLEFSDIGQIGRESRVIPKNSKYPVMLLFSVRLK
jgi:hypothetical protein